VVAVISCSPLQLPFSLQFVNFNIVKSASGDAGCGPGKIFVRCGPSSCANLVSRSFLPTMLLLVSATQSA